MSFLSFPLTFPLGSSSSPTLTATRIGYGSATNKLTGDANLTWDSGNQIFLVSGGTAGYIRVLGGSAGAINIDGYGGAGSAPLRFWSGSAIASNEIMNLSAAITNVAPGLNIASTGQIALSSSATNVTSLDTFLTRGGVATWQLGQANASTPVAHTIQGQGSQPGTDSNTGGANVTIAAGTGTGTGTAASVILSSPLLAASGSSAQTMKTGLTVKGGAYIDTVYTVATLPTGIQGMHATVTDSNAVSFTAGIGSVVASGGATVVPVFYDGTNWRIG